MLVQAVQSGITAVAEITFEGMTIPRSASGDVCYDLVAGRSTSDETRSICDDIVFVVLTNEPVDGVAVQARSTTAYLEMKDEVRVFDEGQAATKGAMNVLGSVDGRLEMISKAVLIVKISLARMAVVMLVGLSVVFRQPVLVL